MQLNVISLNYVGLASNIHSLAFSGPCFLPGKNSIWMITVEEGNFIQCFDSTLTIFIRNDAKNGTYVFIYAG